MLPNFYSYLLSCTNASNTMITCILARKCSQQSNSLLIAFVKSLQWPDSSGRFSRVDLGVPGVEFLAS